MAIIRGEIILPNKIPNLNHNLFKGESSLELSNPKTRKKAENTKNDKIISFPLVKGYKPIKRKTIKKTSPKLLFEPILTLSI